MIKKAQRKIKVELEEDIVLRIGSLKESVNDTYSDVLRRILMEGDTTSLFEYLGKKAQKMKGFTRED